jgi:hypothetical protein
MEMTLSWKVTTAEETDECMYVISYINPYSRSIAASVTRCICILMCAVFERALYIMTIQIPNHEIIEDKCLHKINHSLRGYACLHDVSGFCFYLCKACTFQYFHCRSWLVGYGVCSKDSEWGLSPYSSSINKQALRKKSLSLHIVKYLSSLSEI